MTETEPGRPSGLSITSQQITNNNSVESSGSNPLSPASSSTQTASLGSSPVNSKSLPNIPSCLEPARRSPPATSLRMKERRNPLEKSHSYAILPLRKHLMQKSLAERRSMDDNQYSYMKDKLERERLTRQRSIRPLEEVMEEEQSCRATEEMDVEDGKEMLKSQQFGQKPSCYTPYLGIGPSGLSPLVTSQLGSLSPELQRPLRTGIGFHSAMLKHQCHCDNTKNHPESPERYEMRG